MTTTVDSSLPALQSRIETLENQLWSDDQKSDNEQNQQMVITPAMRRVRRHVQSSHCYSSQWKHCPPNYYSLELEQRKQILGAHSISQLCKACLFENKNYVPNEDSNDNSNSKALATNMKNDPTNSKYYLIIVQYVEAINTKKLSTELRSLRPPGPKRLDPNYFSDMRLAPEEDSDRLTGFAHNGVSPFGLLEGEEIPIVVCKSVLGVRPQFIWMGGGDKDWKLGMAVGEFVKATNAIVLDVSEPRLGV
mmetsp:Transcript_1051/g.2382  ORF Transcript_1051/g.2382 Transcript_1051/m.2382 type:complete len:249 (+) Transcript_1051:107-853(+)